MIRSLAIFTSVGILAVGSSAAEADILKSVFNTSGANLTTTLAAQPLNTVGATAIAISLPAKTKIAITFAGECSSDSNGGWAHINIVVDGTARGVTNQTDDAFCTGPNWVTASMTIGLTLSAGSHTIQVFAAVTGGTTTSGSLFDTSTVVFD